MLATFLALAPARTASTRRESKYLEKIYQRLPPPSSTLFPPIGSFVGEPNLTFKLSVLYL